MGRISAALEQGQQKKLLALCDEALKEGYAPAAILSDGLIQGMNRLGDAFSANRAFVPEMLIAARCMNAVMERLKPLMAGEGNEPVGRACLGTVKGDMHDIGKNLVKIMMEGSGIEVIDLGVDTSAEEFVDTAVANDCGIIACSSLLTTTMQEMRRVVELVNARGLHDRIKIMIGGRADHSGLLRRDRRGQLHARRRCCRPPRGRDTPCAARIVKKQEEKL